MSVDVILCMDGNFLVRVVIIVMVMVMVMVIVFLCSLFCGFIGDDIVISFGFLFLGPIGWGIAGAITITAQSVATIVEDVNLIPKMEADLAKQRSILAAKQVEFDGALSAVSEKIRCVERVVSDASIIAARAERHHKELRTLGATLEGAAREWRSFMVLTESVESGYSQVEKAIKRLGARPGTSGGDIQLAINRWAQVENVLKCADWVKVGEIDLTSVVATMRSMDEIIARF